MQPSWRLGGIIAVPLVIAGVLKLSVADTAYLVSAAIFMAGITTWMQARGVWKIGAKVPCVMGTDFTFVGPSIAVGSALGLPGIFGATVLGSFIEIILSRFITTRRFFRHRHRTVVALIGLPMLPVTIDWAAGYGLRTMAAAEISNLWRSCCNGSLNRYGKGMSFCFVIIVSFCYFLCSYRVLGFSASCRRRIFSIPTPLKYGITFSMAAVIPFITAIESRPSRRLAVTWPLARRPGKPLNDEAFRRQLVRWGRKPSGRFLQRRSQHLLQPERWACFRGQVDSRHVVTLAGILLVAARHFPKVGGWSPSFPSGLGGAGSFCLAWWPRASRH